MCLGLTRQSRKSRRSCRRVLASWPTLLQHSQARRYSPGAALTYSFRHTLGTFRPVEFAGHLTGSPHPSATTRQCPGAAAGVVGRFKAGQDRSHVARPALAARLGGCSSPDPTTRRWDGAALGVHRAWHSRAAGAEEGGGERCQHLTCALELSRTFLGGWQGGYPRNGAER